MTDFGMKISQEGYDVRNAAIKNMTLHSEHYGLKIIAQGTNSFTVTSGVGGSGTVAHGLSYIPGFLAFAKMTGTKIFPPSAWNYEAGYEQFIASSDATNLNFSISSAATSTYTAVVYYYVLADPGQ